MTVGSDHHPFDRLITWIDSWLTSVPDTQMRAVIQYGTARAPAEGKAVPFMAHSDLQLLMSQATIIVAQGGPYSILESVDHGRKPIVVPRRRALGEVVDDHQHAFCTLMEERGQAVVATTERELHAALDRALAEPDAFLIRPDRSESKLQDTVEYFGNLVAPLTSRPRRAILSWSADASRRIFGRPALREGSEQFAKTANRVKP